MKMCVYSGEPKFCCCGLLLPNMNDGGQAVRLCVYLSDMEDASRASRALAMRALAGGAQPGQGNDGVDTNPQLLMRGREDNKIGVHAWRENERR